MTVQWRMSVGTASRISSASCRPKAAGAYRFRLPSEAEWEYAARSGGKPEKYSGGGNVDAVAWHGINSAMKTHRVGTKQPNGLDIYDMSGNVLEWCQDIYAEDAYSRDSRNSPIYEADGPNRVCRGGSWFCKPGLLRSANRGGNKPTADSRYNTWASAS